MKRDQAFYEQDLKQDAEYPAAYFIELLFDRQGDMPSVDTLSQEISEHLAEVELLFDSSKNEQNTQQLNIFYLKEKFVTYENDQKFPVGLSIGGFIDFNPAEISDFERSQCWNITDVDALLSRCNCKVLVGDWMAAGLPYLERMRLLQGWLDLVIPHFPDLIAVRFRPSGKILTADECRQNPYEGDLRALLGSLNIRFFNIAGPTREFLVDSYGLYAFGLPDVQCHFHTLDPNEVVNLVFDVSAYLFQNGDVINNGETVEGIGGERWRCQHESALIQPTRAVLDIAPGNYAAGQRQP